MPCTISLRWDQSSSQRTTYSHPDQAKIFTPTWLRPALRILGEQLNGITFEVMDNPRLTAARPLETFTITKDFNGGSLNLLEKIARNEPSNVSGEILLDFYPDIKDKAVIYSMRDLVRQCVIVGVDECSYRGGYRCSREAQPKQRVYICDLAALQFQQEYNTGRLILVQKEPAPHKGVLDDLIFEHVVGERKQTYEEVQNMPRQERYIAHDGLGTECYIDSYAYRRFVSRDVILAGLALSEMAYKNGDRVNFKFLKYGTGFFAAGFRAQIEKLILPAVVDGLEDLFGWGEPKVGSTIKRVELPFFEEDPESTKRIRKLRNDFGIDVIISQDDALKRDDDDELIVATTNCGDNHAACGNEMRFCSVGAAIAENLESKGNLLCPNINTLIEEKYLDITGDGACTSITDRNGGREHRLEQEHFLDMTEIDCRSISDGDGDDSRAHRLENEN